MTTHTHTHTHMRGLARKFVRVFPNFLTYIYIHIYVYICIHYKNCESLKWNMVFSISQNDLNTDFFFLLLYLIGQVFVKYALGMLAWMPEVCLSANYSIELR